MIAANVQVWVATTPVDMRKSFDALAEVVRSFLGRDPHSGSLFVFRNKGGHLVKILWWEPTGWTLYYKRLEQGVVHFPTDGTTAVEIPREELSAHATDRRGVLGASVLRQSVAVVGLVGFARRS